MFDLRSRKDYCARSCDKVFSEMRLVTPDLNHLPKGSALLSAVTRDISSLLSAQTECVSLPGADLPPLARVNISLRSHGQLRGSMSGQGGSLQQQLSAAVRRACLDTRFSGALVAADLPRLTVEVWLQVASTEITVEQRQNPTGFRFGIDGLEVESGERFAYFKPSVAITGGFETPHALMSALCKKAGLPPDAWQEASCTVRKTTWLHYADSAMGPVDLQGLRSKDRPKGSRTTVQQWTEDGVSYLRNNQLADGSFCYLYQCLSGLAEREQANPVRAAGCAYAMAAAASSPHLRDAQSSLDAADRAIRDLLGRSVPMAEGACYIRDNEKQIEPSGKLGTTALLLVAMSQKALASQFQAESASLLGAIKSAQQANGLFTCVFGAPGAEGSQINYFPGQALLALLLRADAGDESCLPYVQRAFIPMRDHFRRAPTTAFVGWHVDVWSRAARLEGRSEYADFVFEQVDWLLQHQLDSTATFPGGFSVSGAAPGASSVVYTEALARGAHLAWELGDARWPTYRLAFQSALEFVSLLRLDRDQTVFFPHPERAIGGVTRGFANFQVRSDQVQHFITMGLATLGIPSILD